MSSQLERLQKELREGGDIQSRNVGNFKIDKDNRIVLYYGKERRDCDILTISDGDLMMKMVIIKEIDEWLYENKILCPYDFMILRETDYMVDSDNHRQQLSWFFKSKSVPKKLQSYLREMWSSKYKNEIRPNDWTTNEEWGKTNPFKRNLIFSYVGLKEETIKKNQNFMVEIINQIKRK